jgi:hypothetical protein
VSPSKRLVKQRIFIRGGGIHPCLCDRQIYRGEYFTLVLDKKNKLYHARESRDLYGEWRVLAEEVKEDLLLEHIHHVRRLSELDEDCQVEERLKS